jgi:hypothetical protein
MSSGNQGIYQKGLDLMFVEKAIMINIIMTENGFVDHFKLLICDKAGAFLLNHFFKLWKRKFRRIYNVCSIKLGHKILSENIVIFDLLVRYPLPKYFF